MELLNSWLITRACLENRYTFSFYIYYCSLGLFLLILSPTLSKHNQQSLLTSGACKLCANCLSISLRDLQLIIHINMYNKILNQNIILGHMWRFYLSKYIFLSWINIIKTVTSSPSHFYFKKSYIYSDYDFPSPNSSQMLITTLSTQIHIQTFSLSLLITTATKICKVVVPNKQVALAWSQSYSSKFIY